MEYLILIMCNRNKYFYRTLILVLGALGNAKETFIVTDEFCITNNESAIAFISPINETNIEKDFSVSTFYPNQKQNQQVTIDCNIESNEKCTSKYYNTQPWILQNSFEGPYYFNQYITDRRWEELKQYKTKFLNEEGELNFLEVPAPKIMDNFEIPLSIRVEREAHIFICEDHVTDSQCYWVMLQIRKGDTSALRICQANSIPKMNNAYPDDPCKTPVDEYTHEHNIISDKYWTLFKIRKINNKFSVEENDNEILKIDNKKAFSPRRIFIHSKHVEGLWKFHNYTYIYTTKKSTEQLGPIYKLNIGETCISLFYVTCSECSIAFRVQSQIKTENNNNIIIDKTLTTEDERWKEFKIYYNSTVEQDVIMYWTTTEIKKSQQPFWAIDSIRQCTRDEYRVLKSSTNNIPCQQIATQFPLEISNELSSLEINCPENYFGMNCLPCSTFGEHFCKKFKYCELFMGQDHCHCTSGFFTDTCAKECTEGKYGHGCRKQCSKHCSVNCESVNGHCNGKCRNDYTGKKCENPPAPLLVHAPTILDIKSRSCVVRIENFELVEGSEIPLYFKIQYKKNFTSISWNDVKNVVGTFNRIKEITVNNLEPDTPYCVRVVLYSQLNQTYEGNVIEKVCFNTTCIQLAPEDIHIITTSISATVSIIQKDDMCRIYNYKYKLDNGDEENLTKNTLELPDLEPYKSYTFSLRHTTYKITQKEFMTKEGVPSEVEKQTINVTTYSQSIELKWEKPKKPNGRVRYSLKCKLLVTKECTDYSPVNNNYTKFTKLDEVAFLVDIKPYSLYEIVITPFTAEGGEGKPTSITVETEQSEMLSSKEFPKIKSKTTSKSGMVIYWQLVNCADIEGPLYLRFDIMCKSEWCSQSINLHYWRYFPNNRSYNIVNLMAFTNYNLNIYISREENHWSKKKFVEFVNFTTEPSVPNKLKNVTVWSLSEKHISLRWSAPYPPTGNLSEFKILYKKKSYYSFRRSENTLSTSFVPCKLWPYDHCVKINNTEKGVIYEIQIYARNEDPKDFASVCNISVHTIIEKPDPPYNVSSMWTDAGDLLISWAHPDAIKGTLKAFVIKTNHNSKFMYEIKSEDDYNITYKYLINRNNLSSCSNYVFNVVTRNEKYDSDSIHITAMTPAPFIPNITKSDMRVSCTDSVTYVNIPKLQYIHNCTNCDKKMYVLFSSSLEKKGVKKEMNDFENALKRSNLMPNLKYTIMLLEASQEELPKRISINNDTKNCNIESLDELDNVNLYIFFVNECKTKDRNITLKRIDMNPSDPMNYIEEEEHNKGLYALFLLILLIPLGVYLYMIRLKGKPNTETNLMSILRRRRQKSIEEVPLSENENKAITPIAAKPSIKRKPILHVPSPAFTITTKFSERVKLVDFELYVKHSIETGELEKQHGLFPRGQTKPWDYGALKVNKAKNRYNNLVAYDHTRVILKKINDDEYSDYINANYIDGYRLPKAYIATQGPKPATLNDFWRMVWQENVKHIIMLANIYEGGKKKVEKYWPNINEEINFDGVLVQYVSSKVYANYEHRVFKVCKKEEQREVEQFHFTSWPDHGVPLYSQSLVPFLQQILKIPNNSQSPVLVHCSAGVGRTGTIILCDICLRMAAGEGFVDFLANLEHIRSQRPNMVDNVEQYKLAHLVVLECLFGMCTSIECNDDINERVKKLLSGDGIKKQLDYLRETEWQDKAMDTVWSEEHISIYPEKNRFQDILPDKHYNIRLKCYPYHDESSSYINAIQVDGFCSPGRFIVTQQPLPNTVGDFWRMVWDRQSTIIISLNEINTSNETSCQFWPAKKCEINPVDYIKICHENSKQLEGYQLVKLKLINEKENETIHVHIIEMIDWKPDHPLPKSISDFLVFWEECDAMSRKSETVVVTCYDGATASGLYIASTFLIDKIKLEQECDVCLAVRTIRHNRKEFVNSEEQFRFLYEVALMYINGFQSYANFE